MNSRYQQELANSAAYGGLGGPEAPVQVENAYKQDLVNRLQQSAGDWMPEFGGASSLSYITVLLYSHYLTDFVEQLLLNFITICCLVAVQL